MGRILDRLIDHDPILQYTIDFLVKIAGDYAGSDFIGTYVNKSKLMCVVHCTCPDSSTAKAIATELVQQKLAACVNIIPGVLSIYSWQGQIETSQEQLLLIKTNNEYFSSVQNAIIELHPYDLPEIICVPIENGLPDYLTWIDQNVSP